MAVNVGVLREVTDETVKAFGRLLPQLSRSAPPLDHAALSRVLTASCNTVLVARAPSAGGGPDEIIGTLLGGVVVIEAVFGIGGIGSDSVAAIDQGNLPVIIGFVLVAAVFVVVANLIVDFCYTLLDPRVRIK